MLIKLLRVVTTTKKVNVNQQTHSIELHRQPSPLSPPLRRISNAIKNGNKKINFASLNWIACELQQTNEAKMGSI